VIDFHSHLMPGVDDGAATLEASRAGLRELMAQGAEVIITTPHLKASLLEMPHERTSYLARLDAAWDALRTLASSEFPALRLDRGVELLLDVPQVDLTDSRIRLGGTRFVLVEFPFAMIPPQSARVLFEIAVAGYVPIVAHPERYRDMDEALTLAAAWKDAGACLQVNTGSLVGKYGPIARAKAWQLLRTGLADYLSSDFHAGLKEVLTHTAARIDLDRVGGMASYNALTSTNPVRLLQGERPQAVPPLPSSSLWRRLLSRSRS
jgi:protein-tyrosine phosphatase